MANLKHVGKLNGSGDRVYVIFRQLLDGTGKIVDHDTALVVRIDSLPDLFRASIDGIVLSLDAQNTANLYEYLVKVNLDDGRNALTALHQEKRLSTEKVSNITMTVNDKTRIPLGTLIEAIASRGGPAPDPAKAEAERALAAAVAQQQAIDAALGSVATDLTAEASKPVMPMSEAVLADPRSAEQLLNEADALMASAKELRKQAKKLDPSIDMRKSHTA